MVLSSKLKGTIKKAKSKKGGGKGNNGNGANGNGANGNGNGNGANGNDNGNNGNANNVFTQDYLETECGKCNKKPPGGCSESLLKACKERMERMGVMANMEGLNDIIEGSSFLETPIAQQMELEVIEQLLKEINMAKKFKTAQNPIDLIGLDKNPMFETTIRVLTEKHGNDKGQIMEGLNNACDEQIGEVLESVCNKILKLDTKSLSGENNFQKLRALLLSMGTEGDKLAKLLLIYGLINLNVFTSNEKNKIVVDGISNAFPIEGIFPNSNAIEKLRKYFLNEFTNNHNHNQKGGNGDSPSDGAVQNSIVDALRDPNLLAENAAKFQARVFEKPVHIDGMENYKEPSYGDYAWEIFWGFLKALLFVAVMFIVLETIFMAGGITGEMLEDVDKFVQREAQQIQDGSKAARAAAAGFAFGGAILSSLTSVASITVLKGISATLSFGHIFVALTAVIIGIGVFRGFAAVNQKVHAIRAAKGARRALDKTSEYTTNQFELLGSERQEAIKTELATRMRKLNDILSEVLEADALERQQKRLALESQLKAVGALQELPSPVSSELPTSGSSSSVTTSDGKQMVLVSRDTDENTLALMTEYQKLNAAQGNSHLAGAVNQLTNAKIIEALKQDRDLLPKLEQMIFNKIGDWLPRCDNNKLLELEIDLSTEAKKREWISKFNKKDTEGKRQEFEKIVAMCPSYYEFEANLLAEILQVVVLRIAKEKLPEEPRVMGEQRYTPEEMAGYQYIRQLILNRLQKLQSNAALEGQRKFVEKLSITRTKLIATSCKEVVLNIITFYALKNMMGDSRIYKLQLYLEMLNKQSSLITAGSISTSGGMLASAVLATTMASSPLLQYVFGTTIALLGTTLVAHYDLDYIRKIGGEEFKNLEESKIKAYKYFILEDAIERVELTHRIQSRNGENFRVIKEFKDSLLQLLRKANNDIGKQKAEMPQKESVINDIIDVDGSDKTAVFSRQVETTARYIMSVIDNLGNLLIDESLETPGRDHIFSLLSNPKPLQLLEGARRLQIVGPSRTPHAFEYREGPLALRGEEGGGRLENRVETPLRAPIRAAIPLRASPLREPTTTTTRAPEPETPLLAGASGRSAATTGNPHQGGARKKSRRNNRKNRKTKRNRAPMKSKHQKRRNNGRMSSKK
jgi:hypothetical protein